MQKKWEDPNNIYLPLHLNPRKINQGFVESLVESMSDKGFLPQYPVKVFLAEKLNCVEIEDDMKDSLFVCVSGMHRITSARIANVEQVLCEVYDGDDDAFIEMMMTDNFEHDPAQNSEIGQAFSQTEKREACKRMLYIPKFLRLTNTALAEAWHTSEGNIRRWRNDIVESLGGSVLNENSGDFVPASLRQLGVTPERLQELREIANSTDREDADGKIVQIRGASREVTEEEKEEFWDTIRTDAGWHQDGWLEEHGIDDFDCVRFYLGEKYDVKSSWNMYKELSMKQLRDVHGAILSDDADFIAGCLAVKKQNDEILAARDAFREACDSIQEWLLKEFVQGNKWSKAYKSCAAAFTAAAQQHCHSDYAGEDSNFPTVEGDIESYKAALEIVATVQYAVDNNEDWVMDFRKKMKKKAKAEHKTMSENWVAGKQALLDAFAAYPRNLSLAAFCYALEDEYYERNGTYIKLLDQDAPSDRARDDTIKKQTRRFKDLVKCLEEDANWIQAIPEEEQQLRISDVMPDAEVIGIKVVFSGKRQAVWFEDDSREPGAVPLSDVPEEIVANLLMLICDTNLLEAVAGDFRCAYEELGLNNFQVKYGLESACVHYSTSFEKLCQILGYFPDQFDPDTAKQVIADMLVPDINWWISILQSMTRDVETRDNWVRKIT